MQSVCITIGEYAIHATLLNTPTAEAILKHIPFESNAQTWGDEIYFSTPINGLALEDNAKDVVEYGELAYWVEGDCIAIGFGPTPISHADEIRLAAKTNIWATTTADLKVLKNIPAGEKILVNAI